jgi:hypothetical protein
MEERPNYYAIIPANIRYDADLTANAKLLYGEITALCNEKGYCWATNEYFANLYGVSKTSISKWISSLIQKEYIFSETIYKEGTKEILNRYLRIVKDPIEEKLNRGIEEKLKDYKDNNTSINNTINNKEIYKESFEELWKLYPNKKGKTESYKKFVKAIKDGVSIETIRDGIQRYITYIEIEHIKPQYIKNGSTWFNQRCWEDDYSTNRKPTTRDIAPKIKYMDFLKEDSND